MFGRMIEKLTSPGPKHRICEKTHWRFQAQWRPRSGRGKLQVTSEIFGHQVKTFTLDVTLSAVPLKNNYFCLTKGWCKFLLSKTHGILTASISWCLSHKILKRMLNETLFRIVSWTRILCGLFYPMVRQRPKMKGTRFPVFADNFWQFGDLSVCVCAHPACVMKFWVMFSQTKSLHRKKQTGEPKTDQFSTSRFRLTWRANQTRVT